MVFRSRNAAISDSSLYEVACGLVLRLFSNIRILSGLPKRSTQSLSIRLLRFLPPDPAFSIPRSFTPWSSVACAVVVLFSNTLFRTFAFLAIKTYQVDISSPAKASSPFVHLRNGPSACLKARPRISRNGGLPQRRRTSSRFSSPTQSSSTRSSPARRINRHCKVTAP
jgi:hypothetical protein